MDEFPKHRRHLHLNRVIDEMDHALDEPHEF
jgi:hypothetical protein